MQINLTDDYNRTPPKFCPMCGTPSLAKAEASLATIDARLYLLHGAFHGVAQALVTLLYQNWRYFDAKSDPGVQQPPRFIDYMHNTLEEAE